jgi:hypothetical protein
MNKKFCTVLFLLSSSIAIANSAPEIGRIIDVKGSGFVSHNGETHELKKGTIIYPNSEIVVEHSGQVTYADNLDHRFHMSSSTSLAVSGKSVELRSGNMWFQSLNKIDNYKIVTANAAIDFQGGEAILTYDSQKGKSQLMVINGIMKLSNIKVPDLNLSISEGNFSYVDNSYDEGAPRDPTPVGEKTYKALISDFSGVKPFTEKQVTHEVKREIASTSPHELKKHEESNHEVNNTDKMLEEYKNGLLTKKEKVIVKKVSKKAYAKKEAVVKTKHQDSESTPLVVKIYGVQSTSTRMPASVKDSTSTNEKTTNEIKNNITTPSKETEKLLEKIKNL